MLMEKYDMLKFAWPGLQWHDALLNSQDVQERVGILVCMLGVSGEDFLRSLHLPKEFTQEILGAWKVTREKMSPLGSLSPLQKKILKAVVPGLPPMALEPCFVRGRELKDLGLAGRRISGALDRVRQAQWAGEVKTREEAQSFLKAH